MFRTTIAGLVCAALCAFMTACCSADSGGNGYYGSDAGWPSDGGGNTNIGTGGAQDIGQFRQIIEQGGIPAQSTLSANGFFSEHHTELPEPGCGESICLHGMLSVGRDWVWNGYQAAVQLGMNSPVDSTQFTARPKDLVVVVDVSGSMADESKLVYAKQGLHLLIDELGEADRLALVTYSEEVTVLAELDHISDPSRLHNLVDSLSARHSTNFYDGLRIGLQIAAELVSSEREPRVVILSDGMPTYGTTDDASIIAMADGYIQDGVGLTTIGMGLQFNVNLMRGLAERGAGNFYFLEDSAAIEEVFTEELGYFVTPLAFDLELQAQIPATYILDEVVGTTLWTENEGGGTVSIPSVFLASRLSHEDPPAGGGDGRRGGGSAIMMALLPGEGFQRTEDLYRVAELSLSYRPADGSDNVVQSLYVMNPALPGDQPPRDNNEVPYVSDNAMAKNFAMYNIYLGLYQACHWAETNYDHALWILDRLKESAQAWNYAYQDDDIETDIELIEKFRQNLIAQDAEASEP